MKRNLPMSLAVICTAFLLACPSVFGEVTGWRGDGSGRYPDAQPPRVWSKEGNVVWKTELPGRAYASPVLSDGRLYVTAEPAEVICIDADGGKILWQGTADYTAALGEKKSAEIDAAYEKFETDKRAIRVRYDPLRKADPDAEQVAVLKMQMSEIDKWKREFAKQFPEQRRGGAGNAAATPLCDGERLFVTFGTGIVAAFDLGGKRQWAVHIEGPQQGFGHSASPVLAGGKLIVHFQDLVALDPSSGKELWRTELPAKFGTSAVVRIADEDALVTPSGAMVRAADGRVVAEKLFQLSNNSPLVHEGIIYAHESGKTKALPLPPSLDGNVQIEPLWEESSTRDQRMASAVYHDGLLYAAGRRGVMDVTDAKTGDVLYRKRLDLGDLFPSVVLAGNLVFISGRNGKTLVLRPGREYDEVAVNELDRFGSTPIFAGQRLYLRTEKFMYCIGK